MRHKVEWGPWHHVRTRLARDRDKGWFRASIGWDGCFGLEVVVTVAYLPILYLYTRVQWYHVEIGVGVAGYYLWWLRQDRMLE
jgi:hypothetical protein